MAKTIQSLLLYCGLLGMSATLFAHDIEKTVIGPVEKLKVVESGLKYRARIDTGATRSSLHAINISIENAAKDEDENIGKWLNFTTTNHRGDEVDVRAKISDVVHLRNSMGTSIRYAVPLTLSWKGVPLTVNASLADRTNMQYKLLIGRDWLSGRYLVDVDYPEED